MTATSREIVLRTLEFRSPPRVPRQLWVLPWAGQRYPDELNSITQRFPTDMVGVAPKYRELPTTRGDPYAVGTYVDEWGCRFTNIQSGTIGEVREPLIRDWDRGWSHVHFPREWLTFDAGDIDRQCGETDGFVMAGACPRPFEQIQFLRTTENLYLDLLDPPKPMLRFLKELHAFYCEVLEAWAKTQVDGLMFMDDWGSQRALLISPRQWREIFRPMYRDYIAIAHAAGKKIFMHSDGYILDIYPDLIELGLDAVNSQIFCMTPEALAPFAGKITFWGEIDRQHLLPYGSVSDIDAAVRRVHRHLWKDGGCIAQCEFGPGAKPGNVAQVFQSWSDVLEK